MKKDLLVSNFTLKNETEINRAKLPPITDDYPFSIPVIKNFKRITFRKQVTFIIGENGSGKSTLIEAFARCCRFNPEGGSRNFRFSIRSTESDFYKYLNMEKSFELSIFDGYFLRSETLYNLSSKVERLRSETLYNLSSKVERISSETLYNFFSSKVEQLNPKDNGWEIPSDYGEILLHEQSHGESVLSLLTNRLIKRGLYLFDEPETGLSVKNLFAMMTIINDLVKIKSQFIICTHSPILLAYPNSEIYEIKNGNLKPVKYEDTDYYSLSRYFFTNYKGMLRKLEIGDHA